MRGGKVIDRPRWDGKDEGNRWTGWTADEVIKGVADMTDEEACWNLEKQHLIRLLIEILQ